MARVQFPADRFDEVIDGGPRVGAHRAENPHLRAGLILFWAVLATIVLFAAGVFVSLVAAGRVSFGPAVVPSYSSTPQVPAVRDTSYRVLILNATTDSSLGTRFAALVEGAGWNSSSVSTATAASTGFPRTTIYYSSPADLGAAKGLSQVIGGAELVQSDAYSVASSATASSGKSGQLTIVIGADATATPAS